MIDNSNSLFCCCCRCLCDVCVWECVCVGSSLLFELACAAESHRALFEFFTKKNKLLLTIIVIIFVTIVTSGLRSSLPLLFAPPYAITKPQSSLPLLFCIQQEITNIPLLVHSIKLEKKQEQNNNTNNKIRRSLTTNDVTNNEHGCRCSC